MNHVRSIVRVDKAHQCGIYGQGVGIAIVDMGFPLIRITAPG